MVAREGRRRLREAGVERYEAREILTGLPMPTTVRAFKVQMEFAVQALSTLNPLPADYMSDGYWPEYEGATRIG